MTVRVPGLAAPAFNGTTVLQVAEYSANGSYVGTIFAFDKEFDPFVFEMAPSMVNSPFLVDAYGMITVNGYLDFEVQSMYVISVTLNETITRACPFSSNASFVITLLDVPEPPYFSVLSSGFNMPEEQSTPYNTSGTAVFTARDVTAGNTSTVTVAVTAVTIVMSLSGVTYSRSTALPYFVVVSPSGGACVGGVACVLQVSSSSPRMDYDVGLRGLNVTITATGATGLTTSVVVPIVITNVNEGE